MDMDLGEETTCGADAAIQDSDGDWCLLQALPDPEGDAAVQSILDKAGPEVGGWISNASETLKCA
jgi:hypothetical protein